ncbi:MAG: riboflavin synthase [Myxococcales bacterium]
MFTGLIQDVGVVLEAAGTAPLRLRVETALPAAQFTPGESIAIDGVCLTVVERARSSFAVEAAAETLARTTVGSLSRGRRVNLERAVALGDRLGGHLVLGHVDGPGRVTGARREGGGRWLEIEASPAVVPFLLEKGSIALDGVSLTVNGVAGSRFYVLLIPETLARTNLGDRQVGEAVNLEADVIGKYVARLLGMARPLGVDLSLLQRAGFA